MQHEPGTTDAPDGKILVTAVDAARLLGIGRTTVFALMKSGRLRSVQIGRSRRIPMTEVKAFANRLIAEQNPETYS